MATGIPGSAIVSAPGQERKSSFNWKQSCSQCLEAGCGVLGQILVRGQDTCETSGWLA